MEPVTYMINLVTMTTGIYFFALYGHEYSYPTFHERVTHSRLARYYSKYDFDIKRYNELCRLIAERRSELEQPELMYLKHLSSLPNASL
jgi:hypothetical protein